MPVGARRAADGPVRGPPWASWRRYTDARVTDTPFPFYLGPYKVVSELGAGGFATVYRAIVQGEMGFSREVALKVLHPHITRSDRGVVKMLADEALLLARMQHPNIVYVQWFGQLEHPTEGMVFAMMMEYVPGRTLREIQDETRGIAPLPLSVALDIHLDILKGLRFAHEIKSADGSALNLVHRDLKPDNVIISKEGAVKLLDFGIAKASERLVDKTEANMVRGTVHYMSPEQVRGEELDARSDLFAFGAMLFETLTGRRMISGSTLISAMHKVAAFEPDQVFGHIEEVVPEAIPVLRKFIAQNRDDRYATTAEALKALRVLRDQVPSSEVSSVFLSSKVRAYSPAVMADTRDISLMGDAPAGSVRQGPPMVSGAGQSVPDLPTGAVVAAGLTADLVPPTVDQTRIAPPSKPSNRMGVMVFGLGAAAALFGVVSLWQSGSKDAAGETGAEIAASPLPQELQPAEEPITQDAELTAAPAPSPDPNPRPAPSPAPTLAPKPATPTPVATPRSVETAATPAPASKGPGTLKIGANAAFELSIAHKRYNRLQAGRGIELPAGSYRVRLDCIACPEGVDPSLSLDVVVRAGEQTKHVLSFPDEG